MTHRRRFLAYLAGCLLGGFVGYGVNSATGTPAYDQATIEHWTDQINYRYQITSPTRCEEQWKAHAYTLNCVWETP